MLRSTDVGFEWKFEKQKTPGRSRGGLACWLIIGASLSRVSGWEQVGRNLPISRCSEVSVYDLRLSRVTAHGVCLLHCFSGAFRG